jgi:DNA modification methylase
VIHFIEPDKILVSVSRQRQEFDPVAMEELRDSILDRGLLQPIVLRQTADGPTLVCGERRLRAMKDLFALGLEFKFGQSTCAYRVPYNDLGELPPLEAEEAELDENLKRRDLSWQEHAAALSRLHVLRNAQAIAKGDMSPVTPIDIASELYGSDRSGGDYGNRVRKNIIVAQHLDNPAIAKAKSSDEAFKILKKQEQTRKNTELAAAIGKTYSADDHQLFHASCLDYLKDPAVHGKFDVILTDPPYGMGADDFGDGGGKLSGIEHHYDDSPEAWRILMAAWCPLAFAAGKPQCHAYVFCDFDRFHELKGFMQAAGWYVFRTPFVVHKLNSGRVPLPDRGPRRQYELVLYGIKGDKPVTHIYPDVIPCTADENMSHGAQKPVSLYENLLQRSVRPGDTVGDFFCGTGPIFEAAARFKCYAIGTEQNADSYGMSVARLRRMKESENMELELAK